MGSSASHAAELATKVAAQHRWCVSGTPFGNSTSVLNEVAAICRFLHYAPFNHARTWKQMVDQTTSAALKHRIIDILAPIWRRNTAEHCQHELQLPPIRASARFCRLGDLEQGYREALMVRASMVA